MRRKPKGFTLIELLVVIAIIALLISILLPSLSRARELSKRLVCAANIKGVGTSAKIYANDNNERWMVPPFKAAAIDDIGIEYLFTGRNQFAEVGFDRFFPSTSETTLFREAGSTAVSTTRAFWMLVRSGDVTVNQFVCPSSGDDPDETENLELYYDFEERGNISYGYQVPFGPRDTQPREGADNRQVLSADRGPWYAGGNGGSWGVSSVGFPTGVGPNDSPKAWRQFNSPNHGGRANGEGQNCLFADGHVSFERTPIVGIDSDNIYTVITDDWGQPGNPNVIHGDTPHDAPTAGTGPYPGQDALGQGAGNYVATDSLIYP